MEPDQRYQNGVWYPCLHNFNRAKAVQYNISIAHSLAVAAYRRAKADGCMLDDSRIGLINCFTPPYTRENPSEADLEAVRMTDGINNRWWLDLVTEGKLPADILADFAARGVELPVRPGDEQILARGKVDWLGCNYYHPERVQAPSRDVDEAGCPAVISAFLTTGGDIRAAIWQVLEIVIAMAIYLPFMKVPERVQAKQAVLAEESAE